MAITGGFGTRYDFDTGRARNWYVSNDGVRRWVDNDEPCDMPTVEAPSALGGVNG